MPNRLLLSNDSTVSGGGIQPDEEVLFFTWANETSAHGTLSATLVPVGIAKANGVISDVFVGVVLPAVSASGFVSGTVDATVNINSAAVLSTAASILMAGSAGAAVRKASNNGGGVSAVVNTASAAFSAGDQISIDYNSRSVGSAAAGAAGKGLYVGVTVRYAAR